MKKKAVALLSGGLDSKLAIRIVQAQGIEIEALSFKTQFNCCNDEAGQAARELGVPVTMLSTDEEYLRVVEKPKYGYGRAVNPCTDCRIYMFALAAKFMEKVGASFMISGEVIGQRPNSQMKRQLEIIDRDTGLGGLLVRPLSAKLLPPTKPEIEGILDREKLHGISGRSRKELIQMAHDFGMKDIPQPSTGCLLTEPEVGFRVKDIFKNQKEYTRWDFDLVKFGRHFRLSENAKVILGKSEEQNLKLEAYYEEGKSSLFIPNNFYGPSALLIGELTEETKDLAIKLLMNYSKKPRVEGEEPVLDFKTGGEESQVSVAVGTSINPVDYQLERK